jgi:hypothetical protein
LTYKGPVPSKFLKFKAKLLGSKFLKWDVGLNFKKKPPVALFLILKISNSSCPNKTYFETLENFNFKEKLLGTGPKCFKFQIRQVNKGK